MVETRPTRRRSGLLQGRSRETRQRLVRAALALWAERGFERGIEETTVEEIVQAAGVTKGTFYFHFSRKEEILLEMGWDTAEVVNEEVRRCLKRERGLDDAVPRVLASLSRHVQAASPAAVGRAVAEFRSNRGAWPATVGRAGIDKGFTALFVQARERGELGPAADPEEAAQMLEALVMESLLDWAGGEPDLSGQLRRRSRLLLSGLHATFATPPAACDRTGRRGPRQPAARGR